MDILGPYETFQQVVEIIKKVKARYDAVQGNPKNAAKLIHTYEFLATRLETISENDQQIIARFPAHHADYFNGTLSELNNSISQTVDQLSDELKKLDDPVHAATHAMRSEALFSTLQKDADQAKDVINRIQETLAPMSVKDDTSSSRPRFRPCNTAPPNTIHAVLDFISVDEKGALLTCEGQLKAAILSSPDGQSVGAVASGMAGVGKTCTLRAIAHHPDIRKRFRGGILFMSLGKDATIAKLIECLCDAVESTGGSVLADELRRETVLAKVISKVRDWFYDHACLFIFDDVWCCNGVKPDILEKLLVLASNSEKNGGSRLVYSTRDENLKVLGTRVAFKPRESQGTSAAIMLLKYAEAKETELHDPICEKAIEKILNMCAGLPVALGVAGRGVCWKREKCQGDRRECWVAYLSTIEKDGILDETASVYGNLRRSLMVSLDYLDEQRDTSASSYKEMHRSLCILQKKDWICAGELRYLWGLAGEDAVIRVIETMGRSGIADEDHRRHKGRLCVGLHLHDLVHDFACREAEEHGEMMRWHERLLDVTRDEANASRREACWPASLGEEEYVFRNICRLLEKSGRAEEVWSLLLSPQWIVRMVETSSILRLEEDIIMCTQGWEDGHRASALNMVGRAARLSLSDYFEEPDCVWFQLYARLFIIAQSCETTRRFLERIEATAPKPWLKPIRLCIKGASDALLDSFVVPERVADIQFLDEEETVVYRCGGEEEECYGWIGCGGEEEESDVWIVKQSSDRARSEVRFQCDVDADIATVDRIMSAERRERRVTSERSVENVSMPPRRFCGGWRHVICCWKGSSGESPGNSEQSGVSEQSQFSNSSDARRRGMIKCLAIGKDGRRIVTGDSTGLVRIWDVATGLPQGEPDSMHSTKVDRVAISGDSRLAVSWSRRDGSLRMWNAETARQEGEELESEEINCVSITRDGKFIVSGGYDWNLRAWNADTRKCLCTVDLGYSIIDVAISDEGKRAVCGLMSKSTVLLLDVENGALHAEYEGHTKLVYSVDISGDGTCVVSGSEDNTVRVWDVETGRQVLKFTGHTGRVDNVAISADKRRLMSASHDDKTICLWNLETSTQTDILPTGHNTQIKSVSICRDGKFVVSCDRGRRIRLWGLESHNDEIWMPDMEHASVVSVSACEKWTFLGTSLGRVRMWSNGQDIRAYLWSTMTTHWHRELFLLKNAVDFAVSEDEGDVVLLGQDNVVHLFRPEDHLPRLLSVPGAVIWSVAISPYGTLLAFGLKEGNIHLWDRDQSVERGEPLVGHTAEVLCLAFKSRSHIQHRFVSGSKDLTVRVWDITTREQFGDALVGHTDWVCSVAMNYYGRYVVSGSRDMTVRVWDVDSEDRTSVVLRGHTRSVHSVAIDEDGTRVVSGSEDKTIRVWDVKEEKHMGAPLCVYSSAVRVMAFEISNDGMYVMCRSRDGAARWWNAESGNLMGVEVGGHMGEVYKIVESKDGKFMAVASRPVDKYHDWNPKVVLDSPQVRVWDLETFECIYMGGEDKWNDVSRDYLGLDVSLDVEKSNCVGVNVDSSSDEVGEYNESGFRPVGRGIAFGEGSGKILANFEADITSLDVDHQNELVAAGLDSRIVAILRIVE